MKSMDSTAANISKIVALLTAIRSNQEELAYEMVLESDPIELFSTITGVLLGVLGRLSDSNGLSVEQYLQELGRIALKNEY
jgi:hypothetical protein